MSERGARESFARRLQGALSGAAAHPASGIDAWLRLLLCALLIPWYAYGLGSDALTHGDEAYWVAAGTKATSLVFVDRQLHSPDWQLGATASVLDLRHPTQTAANRNPKLATLLIGISVHWLDVPRPRVWRKEYVFRESPEWNRQRGLLPPRATLLAGRLPVAALGVLAALWFFQLLRTLLGPGWSCAGALLLATSPMVMLLCRRAMLDGPAYAFSIGAILWTIQARAAPTRWKPALLAGLFAWAALSSKLNAGILIPVIGLAFVGSALSLRSATPLARGGAAALLALALFVLANPTLYVGPLEGMLSMLRLGREIGGLGEHFGYAALPTFGSRVAAAYDLLLLEHGILASRLSLPLDAPLLAGGLLVLAVRARSEPAARVLLLWLGVALLAVCLWPPVRWDRYFLPALAPIAAAETLALAVIGRAVLQLLERMLPAAVAPEPSPGG